MEDKERDSKKVEFRRKKGRRKKKGRDAKQKKIKEVDTERERE